MGRKREIRTGADELLIPAAATEFEKQLRRLALSRERARIPLIYESGAKRNRNRCYIPEWLLDA
jgi:hypothetical protein